MQRCWMVVVFVLVVGCSRDERAQRAPAPLEAVAARCRTKELGCPRPIFAVRDLQRSLAYYRDKLGFKIDWEWGEPAEFASVSRSDLVLFISQERYTSTGGLWVFARDVDGLYRELERRDANIDMPPRNMPWGNRELWIRDLDFNMMRFAGPTKQ